MTDVIVIAPGYPPEQGGIETHVQRIASGVAASGARVEVWAPRAGVSSMTTSVEDNVIVRRFPATSSTQFRQSPALWAYARRHTRRGDIVHVHGYHATASLAGLAVPSTVPLIFTPHYHGTGHSRLATYAHAPYRFLGRTVFAKASVVVAVSGAERSLIERDFRFAGSKAVVLHNGVDLAAIHVSEPFPREPPTVLVVSRLEPHKCVDEVISAFGRVKGDAQLVVIGDGSERSKLEGIRQRSERRDDIRLLGRVSDAVLKQWQRTAHGVVSMSRNEAFGLVGAECVAAGGRAVLSDIPAHRELAEELPPASVELVRPENLARAIEDLLGFPPQPPRHVRSWADVAHDHLDLYDSLLKPGAQAAV